MFGIVAVEALKTTESPAASPNVVLPVLVSVVKAPVVKAPVLGVPFPIGPGVANLATKPLPETVPEADRAPKAPVPVK